MSSKAPAVVLCSGGLRSFVCAALAAREHRIGVVHIKDGRTPAAQLLSALDRQTVHLKPAKTWVIDAPYIRQMSLPPETMGVVTSESSDAQSGRIPMRELQFLAIAAGLGRSLKAGTIYWGIHHEPKENDAMSKVLEVVQVANSLLELMAPENPMIIKTPLLGLDSGQLIELGHQIGVPFAASWTCQLAMDRPCMSCPACAWRIRAFRAAQLIDPLMTVKKDAK